MSEATSKVVKRLIRFATIVFFLLLLVVVIVAIPQFCSLYSSMSNFYECGDLWDKSPSKLLFENDLVALSELKRIDTLMNFGKYKYYGGESEVFVIDYIFRVSKSIKNPWKQELFSLLKVERRDYPDTFITGFRFRTGEESLIYGNEIESKDSLFLILSTFARVDLLSKLFRGETISESWDNRITDSSLALNINNSTAMQSLLKQKIEMGIPCLYCTDFSYVTPNRFWQGKMCYYDSSGQAHSITSKEYLEELSELIGN